MGYLSTSPDEVSREPFDLPRSFLNDLPAIRGENQLVAGAEVDLLEHGGLSLGLHGAPRATT